MSTVEKLFDISKAEELRSYYKNKRKKAKQKLIEDLISWQYFFGEQSIIGINISLVAYYKKSTVLSVLNDLEYKLDSFNTSVRKDLYGSERDFNGKKYGRDTNFSFSK